MPCPPRANFAGGFNHALNRRNAKNDVFFKDADYEAFKRVIQEGLEKNSVGLLAYQWMKNYCLVATSCDLCGSREIRENVSLPTDNKESLRRTSYI